MKKLYILLFALLWGSNLSAQDASIEEQPAQKTENRGLSYTSKNNRFSFSAGGHIDMRVAYDFGGMVDHLDFAPAAIPVPADFSSRQKLRMDATTSYFFVKGQMNSEKLGPVQMLVDLDFRGGKENSYTPRIRCAYLSFKGLTLGRNVSTLCDLDAAPMTIDFEQPNSYTFHFVTMISYRLPLVKDHLTLNLAAEMPALDTNCDRYPSIENVEQRVPDFPVFLQYDWGKRYHNHVRFSAVFRDLYYHNVHTGQNSSLFGWGVLMSGHVQPCRAFELFWNGEYGQAISSTILDLGGQQLDFTPDEQNPARMKARKMWGWQAGAHINLRKNLYLAGGYSQVGVDRNGESSEYRIDSESGAVQTSGGFPAFYHKGEYMFGNIFYQFTKHCQLAAEYLHGRRENMNGEWNSANRIQFRIRYKF